MGRSRGGNSGRPDLLVALFLFTQSAWSGAVATITRAQPDCTELTSSVFAGPFYEGTLARILRHENLTEAKLRQMATVTKDSDDAIIYKTSRKFKVVLKWKRTHEEVGAFYANKRLRLNYIPQTELVSIEGKIYSAQKVVDYPEVQFTKYQGAVAPGNIARVASNPLPDTLVLLDAFLGNIDRAFFPGKNYFILTKEPLPTEIDIGKTGYIEVTDPVFVGYDHGLAFTTNNLVGWLRNYAGGDWDLTKLKVLVKRSPEFVENLRAWTEEQIREDYRGHYEDIRMDYLIERRRELLNLFDE